MIKNEFFICRLYFGGFEESLPLSMIVDTLGQNFWGCHSQITHYSRFSWILTTPSLQIYQPQTHFSLIPLLISTSLPSSDLLLTWLIFLILSRVSMESPPPLSCSQVLFVTFVFLLQWRLPQYFMMLSLFSWIRCLIHVLKMTFSHFCCCFFYFGNLVYYFGSLYWYSWFDLNSN